MSSNVRSGCALAGGVAPAPGRPARRLIQTVFRPSSLAGTWSWKRDCATWMICVAGHSNSLERELEVVDAGLIRTRLLSRDDPLERLAKLRVRGCEKVVVAVRDHAQVEICVASFRRASAASGNAGQSATDPPSAAIDRRRPALSPWARMTAASDSPRISLIRPIWAGFSGRLQARRTPRARQSSGATSAGKWRRRAARMPVSQSIKVP